MTLHEQIRNGLLELLKTLPPGSRIPSEPELSRQYQVARMTVNKVITELTHAGYLRREQGRGTFVLTPASPVRTVTFLLPCSGFLLMPNALILRQILASLTEHLRQHRIGVDLRAVSPDNNMDQIDFSVLDHLNADSIVVVYSCWFHEIFPFLKTRGCRVILIDRQVRDHFPHAEATDGFQILDSDLAGTIRQSIRRLHQKGCRRIAIRTGASKYYSPHLEAYLDEIKSLRMPELTFNYPVDTAELTQNLLRLNQEDAARLQARKCDGMILDCSSLGYITGKNIHEVFNLPGELEVELFRYDPSFNYLTEAPACSWVDYEEIGAKTVQLITGTAVPGVVRMPLSFQPEQP